MVVEVARLANEDALRGLAVAARAAKLIHVQLHALWHTVVDQEVDVGQVDALAKSVVGDQHVGLAGEKVFLRLLALLLLVLLVIRFGLRVLLTCFLVTHNLPLVVELILIPLIAKGGQAMIVINLPKVQRIQCQDQ